MSSEHEPVLCYVETPWLYFTTQPLDQQWGDDWDDAPYEHNAGLPYTYHPLDAGAGRAPWTITQVAYDGPFETPSTHARSSNYSVEMINHGAAPWLRSDRYAANHPTALCIYGGWPYSRVVAGILEAGGMVYVPLAEAAAGGGA